MVTARAIYTYTTNTSPTGAWGHTTASRIETAHADYVCGVADESSSHLGEYPELVSISIFETLDETDRFTPEPNRNSEDAIIDNLFIYIPEGQRPESDLLSHSRIDTR